MAKCPNCNKKLYIWNIKAECPHCKANIPNHNWEERLEEDALQREKSFFKMHTTLKKLSFSTVGNPFRIARLALSVLPAIGFVIPVAALKIADKFEMGGVSLVNLIIGLIKGNVSIAAITDMLSAADTKQTGLYLLLSLAFFAGSLLFGIIALAMIPILCKHPKSPVQAVFHAISLGLYIMSPVMLGKFAGAYSGEVSMAISPTIYVGAALFALVFIADIILVIMPLKENDGRYIPTDDLQREYAISIGAIGADEYPRVKEKKNSK